MAIEHDAIADSELHEPKGIVGASVGQVYVSNGGGSGTWINIEGANTVLVTGLSDLPTPVGGVITLAADTYYAMLQDINFGTNRLVFGDNTVVAGVDSLVTKLTYTGSGAFFTSATGKARIKQLEIECVSGSMVDITSTDGSIFRMQDITFNCGTFGVVNGGVAPSGGIVRFTLVSGQCQTNGVTFTGNLKTILFDTSAVTMTAGTYIDLNGCTFDSFYAKTQIVTLLSAGSIGISGSADSSNVNVGGGASVTLCKFFGSGSPIDTISVDDVLWEFKINPEIADSREEALLSLNGNTTETIITATNTPVLVAGTWNVEDASQLTADVNGRITNNTGKPVRLAIDMAFTATTQGGTDALTFYVYKSGVQISNSAASMEVQATDPTRITLIWADLIDDGEYLEAYVENNSDTSNVTVEDAVFRVI